jgi:hypothetical protein
MAHKEVLEQGDVAAQILGGAQDEGQGCADSVVDGSMQGKQRSIVVEPGKDVGVELYTGPHQGGGSTTGATPAAELGGQAGVSAKAPDRATADQEAIDFAQLLGGVAVVEAGVRDMKRGGGPGGRRRDDGRPRRQWLT